VVVETSNIDRIANEGAIFMTHYADPHENRRRESIPGFRSLEAPFPLILL